MKKVYKITAVITLFLIIIGLIVFLTIPFNKTNSELISKIYQSSIIKNDFEKNIKLLLEAKSNFYVYNALLDKYNTQIPLSSNIPNLTDQIYEIEKYSGVKVQSINYKDINIQSSSSTSNKEQEVIGNIIVDLNINGTYYQILTFINTLEIMPRFIKIENISTKVFNEAGGSSENASSTNQIVLTSLITFRTFYDKTNYNK